MTTLVKDQAGELCGAKAWFSIASAIILVKYAVADMTILAFSFGAFDATGASMLLGTFGAVYFGRAHTKASKP